MLFVFCAALAVDCTTSYDRENDVLTVNCVTLEPDQTITVVLYSVNGGVVTTGQKWWINTQYVLFLNSALCYFDLRLSTADDIWTGCGYAQDWPHSLGRRRH